MGLSGWGCRGGAGASCGVLVETLLTCGWVEVAVGVAVEVLGLLLRTTPLVVFVLLLLAAPVVLVV